MSSRIRIFLTGLLTLLTAALLALAPVGAKPASGGYQLFEPGVSGHQVVIQLAALENFDYHAKIAPECCNAPKGGVIPTIGGRKPINSQWAGKTHPSGIEFDNQGFPKFEPHAEASFQADNLTGNYSTDAKMANNFYGLNHTPEGYTWHHHQDGQTMLLVPKDLHNACRHTGGCAVIRNGGVFD